MPEISVITRVHRGGEYLAQMVASVIAQTFHDWELVLVVTAPAVEAETAAFCERDARVRRIVALGGCGQALAAGCAAARGRSIAVLDEDDLALPRRLELQHAWLALQPEAGLLGAGTEVIGPDGAVLGREPFVGLHEDILAMTAYVHVLRLSGVMFRRELAEKVPYRKTLDCAEDFDFFARAAEVTRAACVPAVLCRYRRHPGSVTATRARHNAAFGGLVRLLTRRRRGGQAEDYERWRPRFAAIAGAEGTTEAEAHRACARILRAEGHADLAAMHTWLAWRARPGLRGGADYAASMLTALAAGRAARGKLARAWLKEPVHQVLQAGGMPDRFQF